MNSVYSYAFSNNSTLNVVSTIITRKDNENYTHLICLLSPIHVTVFEAEMFNAWKLWTEIDPSILSMPPKKLPTLLTQASF